MNNLNKQINDLKFMLESPRLFLTSYYEDLRNQIDQETNKLMLTNEKIEFFKENDQREKLNKLNAQVLEWSLLNIEKIEEKESECLSKIGPHYKFNSKLQTKIHTTIQSYQSILNDETTSEQKLKDLEDSIIRNNVELKRVLFDNKSIMILSNTVLESIRIFYKDNPVYSEREFFKRYIICVI